MSNQIRLFMQAVFFLILFICSFATYAETSVPNETLSSTQDAPAIPLAERNYTALRNLLPRYENAELHPWPIVPPARYRLHTKNSGVIILRERLMESGDLPAYYFSNNPVLDHQLLQAVKDFQARHGLTADGIVGTNTLRELNVPASVRLKQIQVNMQRWAQLSPQLSQRFILVNVPDFRLTVYDDNKPVLSMKAIVGKPDRQTPELSSKVTRIVLNPYWNVPEMIAKKDIAPKVLNNPDYLDEMHIRIFDGESDNAAEINQDEVDWGAAAENGVPYHLRQDPGDDNALGVVKFEFPNTDNVYLHDTPAKNLFDQDVRTFSSGCIRLQNPFGLVDYLMEPDVEWSTEKMDGILATGKTTYVRAARPTPIFITYITAWVDESGAVNFRDDVYHKDDPDNSPPDNPTE